MKPSNVLLDEGDWALLTDFGLARMIAGETRLTATGVGMGTPTYMSPEQGKGEKVDQRTDIYSLGVILCEMVTGRVPYEAETPLAVVLKHIQRDLSLPRSINPAIPEAVERVILKAMAREPETRYGSAGEIAEALKRTLVAPAVSVVPLPKPEAIPAVEPVKLGAIVEEPKRLVPWLPLVVGGGVMLLLVVAVVLLAVLLGSRLLGPRVTPELTKIALSPVISTVEPTPTPRPPTATPAPTATPVGAPLLAPSPTVTSVPRLSGRIVFVSERDGNAEIYVMNADGTGQTNLTNNPAKDYAPAWSPNGRRIAFGSNRDGNAEIYVMNADGSGVTRLTEDPAWDLEQPAWSPNGQRVFYMVWSKTDSIGASQLCSVDMNGTVQTHLANPEIQLGSIALSPDGQRIAFQQAVDSARHTDIFVIGIDGTGLTRLTNRQTYSYHPAWSPDGRRIAFASGSIWVMNADGTALTSLPTGYGSAWAPSWSPDGQWIAFNRGQSHDDEDIFVIRADGTGRLIQLTTSAGSDNGPSWGP